MLKGYNYLKTWHVHKIRYEPLPWIIMGCPIKLGPHSKCGAHNAIRTLRIMHNGSLNVVSTIVWITMLIDASNHERIS